LDSQDEMDDDEDYQRMVDYENKIYNLNHGIDQASENEMSPDQTLKVVPVEDLDEDVSDDSSIRVTKKISVSKESVTKTVHPNGNPPELNGQIDDDSSNLSEDERDMIYSRLYHSSSTLHTFANNPPVKEENKIKNSPRKKATSTSNNVNEQHHIPSTKFTFEIDLDNLPPPPEPTNQATDITSIDEDDDYPVYSNHCRTY